MKGIVGKLTQGAVDAGFVYVTDVPRRRGELKAIELPDALQPSVAYGVAVVKGAEHAEEAQAFVDGLLDGDGAEALRAAGFEPPPPVSGRALPRAAGRARWRSRCCFLTLPVVAIFLDTGPGELLDSLGDAGALDALRLSLLHDGARAGDHRRRRHARRRSCWPRARSAAARGRARWSSCRWCCRRRSRASACSPRSGRKGMLGGAIEDAGSSSCCRPAGVVVALVFVVRAVLPAPGAGGVRGGRPRRGCDASRTLGAGEARDVRCASRSRPRGPGLAGRRSRWPGAARSASSARR